MHWRTIVPLGFIAGTAVAASTRPADKPICDWYTTALLKNNTAENQYQLVKLLVNTVVIGNYTKPNVNIQVPGILAPGDYHGMSVKLASYFDGSLESTNRGGKSGVAINFLDGGGAMPIKAGKAANDTSSHQYALLTHLYGYFGNLLGCTQYGKMGYPAYAGATSMYEVHKFMALDPYEVGYFIEQVGLAAASFGVSKEDVVTVGKAMSNLFGERCAAPVDILPKASKELQAICVESDCPLAQNATCSSYAKAMEPKNATHGEIANAAIALAIEGASARLVYGACLLAALTAGMGFMQ